MQTAGYSGLMYAHSQEAVAERYGAFYPTAAYGAHAGLYGSDSAMTGVYSPYAHHRYFDDRSPYCRGHYEEKYYSNSGRDSSTGSHSTGSYLPPANTQGQGHDSPRIASNTESRGDSYRQAETGSSHCVGGGGSGGGGSGGGGGGSYPDCVASSGGACSRSSSRDACYPSAQAHAYQTPYSNRSESSASDVDVTESDFTEVKRHKATACTTADQRQNNCGSNYDSLMEASRLAEEKRYKEACSRTSNNSSLTNGDSTPKDAIPQSVIMRRQTGNGVSLAELSSRPHSHEHLKLSATIADVHRKSVVEGAHTDSVYSTNHCAYDTYKQSPTYHNGSLHSGRTHPMMPQAGYTSVIVDAQQYHMANGYVH